MFERTVLDDIVDALNEEDRIRKREYRCLILIFTPAVVSGIMSFIVIQVCL